MEKETLNDLLKKMPESPPRMWSIENYQRLLEHIDFGIYKPIFRLYL